VAGQAQEPGQDHQDFVQRNLAQKDLDSVRWCAKSWTGGVNLIAPAATGGCGTPCSLRQVREGVFSWLVCAEQSGPTKPCSSRYSAVWKTLREFFHAGSARSRGAGRSQSGLLGIGQEIQVAGHGRSWRLRRPVVLSFLAALKTLSYQPNSVTIGTITQISRAVRGRGMHSAGSSVLAVPLQRTRIFAICSGLSNSLLP